jgi:NAD(P)-dependent dehydrogenase (short-subunit alcohol dehydrogenase family)
MNNFQDKVTVITGVASGLGRAFAISAAGLGMKLGLADVQQDSYKSVGNKPLRAMR